MDPLREEAVKKEMMLERFQQENPGFDFSNAEFNGYLLIKIQRKLFSS